MEVEKLKFLDQMILLSSKIKITQLELRDQSAPAGAQIQKLKFLDQMILLLSSKIKITELAFRDQSRLCLQIEKLIELDLLSFSFTFFKPCIQMRINNSS